MSVTVLKSEPVERFESPRPKEAELSLLLQQLIRQAEQKAHLIPPANGQDILLDVELEGVRCLLIRLQPQPLRAHAGLSPREVEIARMVAEGYPNKIIADVLDISLWTVGTHLRRIFAKLGVGSRAAMVTRLIEEGVICEYPSHVGLLPLKMKQ